MLVLIVGWHATYRTGAFNLSRVVGRGEGGGDAGLWLPPV